MDHIDDEYRYGEKAVQGSFADKYKSKDGLDNILEDELSDMKAINGPGDMYT